MVLPYTIWPEN